MSYIVFLSLLFLARVGDGLVLIFVKYLVEFTSEAIWSWAFLWWKVYWFNHLTCYKSYIFSISDWVSVGNSCLHVTQWNMAISSRWSNYYLYYFIISLFISIRLVKMIPFFIPPISNWIFSLFTIFNLPKILSILLISSENQFWSVSFPVLFFYSLFLLFHL